MRAHVSGDPTAFRELVARHGRSVHRMARRRPMSEADAGAVVQRTFLALDAARNDFHDRASVREWVRNLATHELRAWPAPAVARSERGERTRDDELEARPDDADPQALGLDVDAAAADLELALEHTRSSAIERLRSTPTSARVGVLFAAAVVVALAASVDSARSPLGGAPTARVLTELVILGATLLVTCVLALRPTYLPSLARSPVGLAIAGTVAVGAALAGWPTPATASLPLGPATPPSWSGAMPCLPFGILVAIPTYLVARLVDRGGRASRWFAAAAGALAGQLALVVRCSTYEVAHRLSTHASVGIVLLVCLAMAATIERNVSR